MLSFISGRGLRMVRSMSSVWKVLKSGYGYLQKVEKWLRVILFFAFCLSFLVFSYPVLDEVKGVATGQDYGGVEKISMPASGVEKIRSVYTDNVENGFCLFGERTEDSIFVEKVNYIESPVYQDYDSMTYFCLDELREEMPEMLTRTDYQLVGNLHTHPVGADLSRPDIYTFGATGLVQRTFGVYNGEEFFFATSNDLYGVDMEVREE